MLATIAATALQACRVAPSSGSSVTSVGGLIGGADDILDQCAGEHGLDARELDGLTRGGKLSGFASDQEARRVERALSSIPAAIRARFFARGRVEVSLDAARACGPSSFGDFSETINGRAYAACLTEASDGGLVAHADPGYPDAIVELVAAAVVARSAGAARNADDFVLELLRESIRNGKRFRSHAQYLPQSFATRSEVDRAFLEEWRRENAEGLAVFGRLAKVVAASVQLCNSSLRERLSRFPAGASLAKALLADASATTRGATLALQGSMYDCDFTGVDFTQMMQDEVDQLYGMCPGGYYVDGQYFAWPASGVMYPPGMQPTGVIAGPGMATMGPMYYPPYQPFVQNVDMSTTTLVLQTTQPSPDDDLYVPNLPADDVVIE